MQKTCEVRSLVIDMGAGQPTGCGYSNNNKPPIKLMVGIPTIEMVMNGGWFIIAIPTLMLYNGT